MPFSPPRILLLAGLLLTGCDLMNTVPTNGSLLLSAGDDALSDGGTTPVTVCAFDADGFPVVRPTRIWLSANPGTLRAGADDGEAGDESTVPLGTDEDGCALATLHPAVGSSTVEVEARSGTVSESVTISVRAAAHALAGSASPSTLGPDGGTATVSIMASGADGQPVQGQVLWFSVPSGSLSPATTATTDASGLATVSWAVSASGAMRVETNGVTAFEVPVAVATPVLTGLAPDCYPDDETTDWGTVEVTLLGSGFSTGAAVLFGGRAATVVSRSEGMLTVHPPPPLPGGGSEPDEVDVTVLNTNGSATDVAFTFAYGCAE